MKNIFLTLLILFTFSCKNEIVKQTKEDIAKEQILNYVAGNFHNPKEYENIEYGALTPIIDYDDEMTARLIADSLAEAIEWTISSATIEQTEKQTEIHKKKLEEIEKGKAEFRKRGKKLLGYTMTDKCRSKNRLGALVVDVYEYNFDTLFNVKNCKRIGE